MEASALIPLEENPHTLWASLVEAVRGSHQDYTAGSLNRAILLLAVPMVPVSYTHLDLYPLYPYQWRCSLRIYCWPAVVGERFLRIVEWN